MRPRRTILQIIALIVVYSSILSIQLVPALALNDGITNSSDRWHAKSENITSIQGIEYEVAFNLQSLVLSISGANTRGSDVAKAGFVITIDNYRYFAKKNLSFDSGEEKNWKLNITRGINVMEHSHTVIISTFGNSTQFNFTKQANSANTEPVPTPYIQNIEVTNGTIDGEPSAVAKVTVANPSIHPYSLKLMVHTLETDGSFYGASVSPGENRTITVELLDERGTQIAGQARLYAGNLSKGDGAMDQVGFAGRAARDTKTWNETYEPVKGPWQSNGYEYHNETYEDDASLAERLSGGYEILGVPIVYVISGLVLGLALFRRIR